MIDQESTGHTNERRSIAKLPVLAGGSVQCLLLDVSRTGARLSSKRRLPPVFHLMFRPDLKRWCEIIWREGDQVGVKFIRDPRANTGSKSVR